MINWLYKKAYEKFHTHVWKEETSAAQNTVTQYGSSKSNKIKGTIVLKICTICGKQEAFFISYDNELKVLSPRYARAFIDGVYDEDKEDKKSVDDVIDEAIKKDE